MSAIVSHRLLEPFDHVVMAISAGSSQRERLDDDAILVHRFLEGAFRGEVGLPRRFAR
jgi:hypothetical protein